MPRGAYSKKERLAIEVVRQSEIARRWTPGEFLSQRAQHDQGCDLFSTPPGGGTPCAIEVKAWGEPLLRSDGSFTYPAEVNSEQLARAKRDGDWRLVIVGNLDAVLAGTGEPEMLIVHAAEVAQRATGWRYRVPLAGLEGLIASARLLDLVQGDSGRHKEAPPIMEKAAASSERAPLTVYITKRKTKSPPKYHTSANCPMVKAYPNDYRAAPSPPPGYTPCQRSGPCRG